MQGDSLLSANIVITFINFFSFIDENGKLQEDWVSLFISHIAYSLMAGYMMIRSHIGLHIDYVTCVLCVHYSVRNYEIQ